MGASWDYFPNTLLALESCLRVYLGENSDQDILLGGKDSLCKGRQRQETT